MSQADDIVPLLSELSEQEREEVMNRYEAIALLLEHKKPPAAMWQEAAEKGDC